MPKWVQERFTGMLPGLEGSSCKVRLDRLRLFLEAKVEHTIRSMLFLTFPSVQLCSEVVLGWQCHFFLPKVAGPTPNLGYLENYKNYSIIESYTGDWHSLMVQWGERIASADLIAKQLSEAWNEFTISGNWSQHVKPLLLTNAKTLLLHKAGATKFTLWHLK